VPRGLWGNHRAFLMNDAHSGRMGPDDSQGNA
jgi:hypothetical protein